MYGETMEDGKSTGSGAKWWSRPGSRPRPDRAPAGSAPDGSPGMPPPAPADAGPQPVPEDPGAGYPLAPPAAPADAVPGARTGPYGDEASPGPGRVDAFTASRPPGPPPTDGPPAPPERPSTPPPPGPPAPAAPPAPDSAPTDPQATPPASAAPPTPGTGEPASAARDAAGRLSGPSPVGDSATAPDPALPYAAPPAAPHPSPAEPGLPPEPAGPHTPTRASADVSRGDGAPVRDGLAGSESSHHAGLHGASAHGGPAGSAPDHGPAVRGATEAGTDAVQGAPAGPGHPYGAPAHDDPSHSAGVHGAAPAPAVPADATLAHATPAHGSRSHTAPPAAGPHPWGAAPQEGESGAVPPPAYPGAGYSVPAGAAYGGPQAPHGAQGYQDPHRTPPTAQWAHYDPWAAPGSAALTHTGDQERSRSRGGRGGLVAGAVLLALGSGVIGGGIGSYVERSGGVGQIELEQAPRENLGRAAGSVAGIAASALPSVVTLHVSGGGEQGTGTGFVLDRRGHILTNNHVVDPAGTGGEISVTFSGGETASATLVGKDSGYDLAVVRVKGVTGLTPLPLGNSDDVRVGDPVVAIGAPFDLQNTVTSGIISAKERPITAGGEKGDGSDISYVDALQTDAPINPGNSGGPLVDSRARVIGINSAIRAADTGGGPDGQSGSIGLGFAIPINQGKRVAEELINTGKATHPVIGVSLDMKFSGDGARVGDRGRDGSSSVTPGGPSARAGVRPGDVITKVDGQRVHSGEELIVKIRAHRPGDRLALTLVRDGRERTLTLTLGSASGS
jgi:putative serine protease PepD